MEQTVSQRLELVLKLQFVDSKLDELRKLRGDLPEEIRDLEDELAGFETGHSDPMRLETSLNISYKR